MKVRIVSGNQAGQVIDQSRAEAESNIATGYAVPVLEAPARRRAPAVREDDEPETESRTFTLKKDSKKKTDEE